MRLGGIVFRGWPASTVSRHCLNTPNAEGRALRDGLPEPVVAPVTKRRATIVEVAERANVAFSTVSRVLNGGYASKEVRGRVEQAARDLGYTPSPIARNLKMGRQGAIGVIVESSQGSWFTQILGGIEEA